MRKLFVTIVLAVTATSVFGQIANALQVKELTLSNGMKVWLNEDHSQPKVAGAVVVKAGAVDCPNTGIAHYFEHILFKGTDKIGTVDYASEKQWLDSISMCYDNLALTTDERERKEIQHDINRLSEKAAEYAIPNEFNSLVSRYGGSGLNAGTTYDYTTYYNTFTPQYLRQWAELNSERMINPVFRLFQGELETVYEEKNMYSDNMLMPALEKAMSHIFKGSPYEFPVIGSTAHLKNPQLSEMRKFYDTYYVAGNMTLILCGDIQSDSIVPLLESTFGRIKPGKAPQRKPFSLQPFDGETTIDIKLPVPIVKAGVLVYRAPAEGDKDNVALDLAMALLSNDNETGMLDSLVNANKMMMAVGQRLSMGKAGAIVLGAIPKIPFGSREKAEKACLEQVERLKRGDFSDAALNIARQEALRNLEVDLESIDKRMSLMTTVIGNTELTCQEFIDMKKSVANMTKKDVMDVATKYMSENSLRLVKKYGSYPKDRVSQPDYKPIVPKNADAESEFAKRLDSIPVADAMPKTIDFNNDVNTLKLTPHSTLYTVKNLVNNIFHIDIIYHKGSLIDPRLGAVGEYLGAIGTDSLSKHDFSKALQRLGTIVTYDAKGSYFHVAVNGFDRNFAESLRLLSHFFNHAKADEKKTAELRQSFAIGRRSFDKSYDEIARAVFEKVAYGNNSSYLNKLTEKELNRIDGDSLLHIFDDLRRMECSIAYSGTLADSVVAEAVKTWLDTDLSCKDAADSYRETLPVDAPTVYVYLAPKVRQTVVRTYSALPKAETDGKRVCMLLWDNYFGGGMSSVMFQELREFRSLAYYASGSCYIPSKPTHPNAPTYYATVMGTQRDKTMNAVSALDSLLRNMPVREKNMELARKVLSNEINNTFPSFRDIAVTVAIEKAEGYAEDANKAVAEHLSAVTADDVKKFYNDHVRHANRAYIIVGDVSKADLKALGQYGTVKVLTKKDILRY